MTELVALPPAPAPLSMGISNTASHLRSAFPDGIPLDSAFVSPALAAALEAAVEDAVTGGGGSGGWVDVGPLLPSVLSAADVAALMQRVGVLRDQERKPAKERKAHVVGRDAGAGIGVHSLYMKTRSGRACAGCGGRVRLAPGGWGGNGLWGRVTGIATGVVDRADYVGYGGLGNVPEREGGGGRPGVLSLLLPGPTWHLDVAVRYSVAGRRKQLSKALPPFVRCCAPVRQMSTSCLGLKRLSSQPHAPPCLLPSARVRRPAICTSYRRQLHRYTQIRALRLGCFPCYLTNCDMQCTSSALHRTLYSTLTPPYTVLHADTAVHPGCASLRRLAAHGSSARAWWQRSRRRRMPRRVPWRTRRWRSGRPAGQPRRRRGPAAAAAAQEAARVRAGRRRAGRRRRLRRTRMTTGPWEVGGREGRWGKGVGTGGAGGREGYRNNAVMHVPQRSQVHE